MWQDTAIEFRNLLWRACSPRSLRVFHLHWNTEKTVLKTPGGRAVTRDAPCSQAGNRVVLVLSDAVGSGWMTAEVPAFVAKWAMRHPTALVHLLPPPKWSRTALRYIDLSRRKRTSAAFGPNRQETPPWLTVTSLESDLLHNYARWMTGRQSEGVAGFRISPERFRIVARDSITSRAQFNPESLKPVEIQRIFERFERFASPEARVLARHLASAPLLLPVMRLVQRTLVPDAVPAQLAEAFQSGILYRRNPGIQPEPHPNLIEYDFLPGLRDRFLDLGGIASSFATIDVIGRYLEQRFGKGGQFIALLSGAGSAIREWNVATSTPGLKPFTRIASFLLERMGYQQNGEERTEYDVSEGIGSGFADVPGRAEKPARERQHHGWVFLCYARNDDEPFVHRVYDALTAAGFDVWFDRVSSPSRQLTFHEEIREAITACDRLILVVGPNAVTSEYVTEEWRFAYFEAVKWVNPILRLGDYNLIPEDLRVIQAEDFRDDAQFDKHLADLIRQLAVPPPPVGKLVGVPELPAHYREQPDRLVELRDLVLTDLRKPVVLSGAAGRSGLRGMGGVGKSVLASALAHRPEVRRAFPDGVYWVTLGQAPDVPELQRGLARALGDDGLFVSVDAGKEKLREMLAARAALLVLDDVWQVGHAEAFNVLGLRGRLLLTTRDAGLVTALAAKENHYQVQLPTELEAEALLAKAAGILVEALPAEARQIVDECGRLPLGLALCGGMVRGGRTWQDVLDALKENDLEYLSDSHAAEEQHRSVWRAMDVSVRALPEDERRRFLELSVFPLDDPIDQELVARLWFQTGGLSAGRTRELLHRFVQRGLIE